MKPAMRGWTRGTRLRSMVVANGVMVQKRLWNREELLLALHLYWRIPFGQQNKANAQVKELAEAIGRTPSAVAMRLGNFTALDPSEQGRVSGLRSVGGLVSEVWDSWATDSVTNALAAEALWQTRVEQRGAIFGDDWSSLIARKTTETVGSARKRLGQDYFRRLVLANFDHRCAITGLAASGLVVASHIVPWAEDESVRLHPGNGIALNRLHDAAFDRKLITFDEDHRLVIGRMLKDVLTRNELVDRFIRFEGGRIATQNRHALLSTALEKHRAAFAQVNK